MRANTTSTRQDLDDLFALSDVRRIDVSGMVRTVDHDTSVDAAKKVLRNRSELQLQVR